MGLAEQFLEACVAEFEYQRRLADRAIAQLDGEQMHRVPHEDGNSVVIQMKHIAGNMVSRWTDFLTTDGDKPWRNRDGEFIDDFTAREQLDATWEKGWDTLLTTVRSLQPEDLTKTVTIRSEPLSVSRALLRQVGHYGYHIGQIVAQAREMRGADWSTLSVARGASDAFNREVGHGA